MSDEPSLPKEWKYTYQPVEEPKEKIPEAPPDPMLTAARKLLRRWDIELVVTGEHRWVQTTGSKKTVWLILQNRDDVTLESLDE